MTSSRKTILFVHPATRDPAPIRCLLGKMGHVAVTVMQGPAALKVLGTIRFDVIFATLADGGEAACRFVRALRTVAPSSAVVGIESDHGQPGSEAWRAECDATVVEPLSQAKVQWVLDFDLRYFGS